MTLSIDILREADGIGPKTFEIIEDEFESIDELKKLDKDEIIDRLPKGYDFTTAIYILSALQENNLRETDQVDENLQNLVSLLKDLFYFDKEDQDFGVPKLMNQRRERLEQFIDEDLIETVHTSIEEMEQNISESELEEAREKVINEINEDAIKPNGEVVEEYKDSDISSVREVVENYQEKKKQAEEIEERENARAEVYNHIYQFFNRYYDKGDFITQRYRTQHEPPYSVPYDGSNTNFHWVTKNQHYAKTSEYLTRFSFHSQGWRYRFVTTEAEKDGETVGKSKYFVMCDPENILVEENEEGENIIHIEFFRRRVGDEDLERCNISGQNSQEKMNEAFLKEIIDLLEEKDIKFERDYLSSKLNEYTSRNQEDFFIHKNLNDFLNNELEEYIKSEIIDFNAAEGYQGINKLSSEKAKAVNEVCSSVISFLTQLEQFKKSLFEKKKFVTNSSHLIPVEQIPSDFYDEIIEEEKQLQQWSHSYGIDTGDLEAEDLESTPYKRMVVDTSLFDNNMEEIGRKTSPNTLIKGDNYQALKFLENKYKNSINAIYIDPPYNTENPNFAYKDNYERPTWLSLMYDRLRVAKELMAEDGAIFVSIDYHEMPRLREMMDSLFGEDNNFVGTFVWKRRGGSNDAVNNFSMDHDYVVCYSKSDDFKMNGVEKEFEAYSNPDDDPRGPWAKGPMIQSKTKEERPTMYYSIEDPETGEVYEADPQRVWGYQKEEFERMIEEDRVIFPEDGEGRPQKKRFKKDLNSHKKPVSSWMEGISKDPDEEDRAVLQTGTNSSGTHDIKHLFGEKVYEYTKPVDLIKEFINQSTDDGDIVLDFFAGSGTTTQAAIELNRERDEQINYLGVELLDRTFEIMEERVRRLSITGDWKDGEPQIDPQETLDRIDENKNSTISPVQCIELENYEDALDSVDFGEEQSGLSQHTDYLLNYMLDFETVSASLMKTGVDRENDIFSKPLEYKLNRDAQKDTTADLMTTFNYLLGLRNVEYEQKEIDGVDYSVYTGVTDDGEVLIIWRHDASEVEDYEAEREEFDAEDYDHIYVNGDSAISGAKLISSAFKRKMFGGE